MPRIKSVARPVKRTRARTARNVTQTVLSAPIRLIHELLKCAGLRACRVQQAKSGDGWSISTVHRTDRGTWEVYETAIESTQLHSSVADPSMRRKLIRRLARSLAPFGRSIA